MNKKILPVSSWLLEESKFIQRLEESKDVRLNNGMAGFVIEGDSSLAGARLIVPEGIIIYRVSKHIRPQKEFFFSARDENSTGQAYLSSVAVNHPEINSMGRSVQLFKCPWYRAKDSDLFFSRISQDRIIQLKDLKALTSEHPLEHYSISAAG